MELKRFRFAAALVAASVLAYGGSADAQTDKGWADWVGDASRLSPALLKDCALDLATARAWYERVRQLHRLLQPTPITVPPGFQARWNAALGAVEEADCRSGPVRGLLQFEPYPPNLLKRDARTGAIYPIDGTSSLKLILNDIAGLSPLYWIKTQDEPTIGLARVTGKLGGYPVVEERFALITPPGAPEPYVPAPAAMVLRRFVAKLQDDLTAVEPLAQQAGTSKEVLANLASLRREFEAAKALERQVASGGQDHKVWWREDVQQVSLQPVGDAAVVMWQNPAFFSRVKGRNGIHVISVDLRELEYGVLEHGPVEDSTAILRRVAQAIDWQAIGISLP